MKQFEFEVVKLYCEGCGSRLIWRFGTGRENNCMKCYHKVNQEGLHRKRKKKVGRGWWTRK